MNQSTPSPPENALADWQRRRIAWQCALEHPWITGDERVLLLCGVAVATKLIHAEEHRVTGAPPTAPAGKDEGACLFK